MCRREGEDLSPAKAVAASTEIDELKGIGKWKATTEKWSGRFIDGNAGNRTHMQTDRTTGR